MTTAINDTPIDRRALALLIDFTNLDPGVDWSHAPVDRLNAAWSDLSRRLATLPKADLDRYWDHLNATTAGMSQEPGTAARRAQELFGTVLGYREERIIEDKEFGRRGRPPGS